VLKRAYWGEHISSHIIAVHSDPPDRSEEAASASL
jgi:hypothetical protein